MPVSQTLTCQFNYVVTKCRMLQAAIAVLHLLAYIIYCAESKLIIATFIAYKRIQAACCILADLALVLDFISHGGKPSATAQEKSCPDTY